MRDEVLSFIETFGNLMRLAAQIRQQQAAEGQVDFGDIRLLSHLVEAGPLRPGDLAERADCDPALITRQSQRLMERGLLERLPDPRDGRAALLAVTPVGVAEVAAKQAARTAFMHEVLAGWSAADIAALQHQLDRFISDFAEGVAQLKENSTSPEAANV